jgi:hypothetical protein
LAEGTLIDSFATAQIRIIPKKGDTTKLKNWRPISLLSNFYKILSRAINNRLKTVVNRVLSRAQKGFTKSRQIQEVILNLDENINRCKNMNIKGAMICVDQSKAFDSVDHQYIEKVFRFFNFGGRFISWLKTIGTNRKACVILGSGKKSDLFDLLKGTAQGDCPSPIIYNICAQILIFKIELSEDIRKLPIFNPDPINLQNIDANFNLESNLETTKNESFADDSTTFTYCEYGDLYALKTILESFAAISGLKCNFEKTTVVRIGDCTSDVDPRILELGFDFSSSCKLLGFQVTNNGDLHTENLNSLKKKVTNTINFWKIFHLSLSGKITVIKSAVYPILNYFLSILDPDPAWLADIGKIIEDFVSSGMNIAKNRFYADPENGGLGLFNPEEFFTALKCTWIKRAHSLCHDNWRRLILNAAQNNNVCLIQELDTEDMGTLCKGIVKSFIKVRNAFGTLDNNFATVPIFNNSFSVSKYAAR